MFQHFRIAALISAVLMAPAPLQALTVTDPVPPVDAPSFNGTAFNGLFDLFESELRGESPRFDSALSQRICEISGRCAGTGEGARFAQANDLVILGSGESSDGGVYVLDSVTGTTISALSDPDGNRSGFGASVAIDGNVAVVGDTGGEVFVFDARTGSLLNRLLPPTGTGGGFGYSVAVAGGRVLVGASDGTGPGQAFLFDAATGQILQRLAAPAQPGLVSFGDAVAFLDNAVAVGGVVDTGNGSTQPTAFLFDAASGGFLGSAPLGTGGSLSLLGGSGGGTAQTQSQPLASARSSLPAVPLPAAGWLIFVAFGGLFLVRRTA